MATSSYELVDCTQSRARCGGAVTRLTSEENEVIDLRFNHNQTISAIARHMDLPRHQIQKIHDEALDKIRQDLESK